MLASALLLSLLTAAPKVAAARFAVVDLSEARADFYTEHFADRLADQGLEVVTPREITTLLGLERQKAMLGCEETSACLTEIAHALGVDAVALGTVAKVGTEYQVNLKIISAQNGRRLAAHSVKVPTESQVVDALTAAASSMARDLRAGLGRPLEKGGTRSSWWWLPATIGVLGAVGGTVGLVSAESARAKLATEPLSMTGANELLQSGQTARTLGWVGVGVGVVGVGTAVVLVLSGSSSNVMPVASLSAEGASFGVVGRLP